MVGDDECESTERAQDKIKMASVVRGVMGYEHRVNIWQTLLFAFTFYLAMAAKDNSISLQVVCNLRGVGGI